MKKTLFTLAAASSLLMPALAEPIDITGTEVFIVKQGRKLRGRNKSSVTGTYNQGDALVYSYSTNDISTVVTLNAANGVNLSEAFDELFDLENGNKDKTLYFDSITAVETFSNGEELTYNFDINRSVFSKKLNNKTDRINAKIVTETTELDCETYDLGCEGTANSKLRIRLKLTDDDESSEETDDESDEEIDDESTD